MDALCKDTKKKLRLGGVVGLYKCERLFVLCGVQKKLENFICQQPFDEIRSTSPRSKGLVGGVEDFGREVSNGSEADGKEKDGGLQPRDFMKATELLYRLGLDRSDGIITSGVTALTEETTTQSRNDCSLESRENSELLNRISFGILEDLHLEANEAGALEIDENYKVLNKFWLEDRSHCESPAKDFESKLCAANDQAVQSDWQGRDSTANTDEGELLAQTCCILGKHKLQNTCLKTVKVADLFICRLLSNVI